MRLIVLSERIDQFVLISVGVIRPVRQGTEGRGSRRIDFLEFKSYSIIIISEISCLFDLFEIDSIVVGKSTEEIVEAALEDAIATREDQLLEQQLVGANLQ